MVNVTSMTKTNIIDAANKRYDKWSELDQSEKELRETSNLNNRASPKHHTPRTLGHLTPSKNCKSCKSVVHQVYYMQQLMENLYNE